MNKGHPFHFCGCAVALWFGVIFTSASGFVLDGPRSGILLEIVSQCLEPSAPNYCTACMAPRADARCQGAPQCTKSTEVWAMNEQYVAMRDIKMCACPSEFVHGLALPRYPVTGVEDPKRPAGIWKFAWDVAISRMEPQSIALVVNPQFRRSQNQLHVHLLRLKIEAQIISNNYLAGYVDQLEEVWHVAEKGARKQGLGDYGVLVKKADGGKFAVYISSESPEGLFTQATCR